MTTPPAPTTAPDRRWEVLCSYGVLDTPAEEPFDRIVAEAAQLFGVAGAGITLITPDRCWFKSSIGLSVPEVPLNYGFCGYAYKSSATLIVTDAEQHAQFSRSPIVTQNGFRFYVGVPLRSPEGYSLGTLFVIDPNPAQPTAQQLERLRALADQVMELLESRRRPVPTPPPPVTEKSIPAPAPRRTVLVVDDEISIRSFVSRIIQLRGLPTLTAVNGQAALDTYHAHAGEIGLVLTDLNMPQMDGLALIAALQALPETPAIAVMTGRLEPASQRALTAANITCIIEKPFSLAQLERALALLPARAATALAPQPA